MSNRLSKTPEDVASSEEMNRKKSVTFLPSSTSTIENSSLFNSNSTNSLSSIASTSTPAQSTSNLVPDANGAVSNGSNKDRTRAKKLIKKPKDFTSVLEQERRNVESRRGYTLATNDSQSNDHADTNGYERANGKSAEIERNQIDESPSTAMLRTASTRSITNSLPSSPPPPSYKSPTPSSYTPLYNSATPSSSSTPPLPPIASTSTAGSTLLRSINGTRARVPTVNNSTRLPSNYKPTLNEMTEKDKRYLNKALASLEISRELSLLSQIGTTSTYGSPFLPHPNGPNSAPPLTSATSSSSFLTSFLPSSSTSSSSNPIKPGWENYQYSLPAPNQRSPILSFLFHNFVITLPALRLAKKDYWEGIQRFLDSFAERDLSSGEERGEVTKRHLLSLALTKLISHYYASVLTASPSSSISTSSTSHPPLPKSSVNSTPARPDKKQMSKIEVLFPGSMKGIWTRKFDEQKLGSNAWCAVADYSRESGGDLKFKIISQILVGPTKPRYLIIRTFKQCLDFFNSISTIDEFNELDIPTLSLLLEDEAKYEDLVGIGKEIELQLRILIISLSKPPTELVGTKLLNQSRSLLESFLTTNTSNTSISSTESDELFKKAEEKEERNEKDHLDWIRVGKEVKELREVWGSYKNALIAGDEIDRSIAYVKKTPKIVDLPSSYRIAEKRACIWVAYALHAIFIESEPGAELLHILKSLHDLVPYAALKLGLSLVNPTLAIKAIVTLVLGQPGGSASLFQRIFSIVVNGGIKHQKKLIQNLRKELNFDQIYEALNKYVYDSFVVRSGVREESKKKNEDILISIIKSYGSSTDLVLVESWLEAYTSVESSSTPHPVDPETLVLSNRFKTAKLLLRAILKTRDKVQVLEIIMEHNTPILIKDSISVFYDTIWKVANATKLADRLGDLQLFLDELIEVCLDPDGRDPSNFINLVARHSQSLYFWIHEMASNGGTLLNPLIEWCKIGLGFLRDGIPTSPTTSSNSNRTSTTNTSTNSRVHIQIQSLFTNNSNSDVNKSKVIKQSRSLQFYTVRNKLKEDLELRLDLLAASSSSSSSKRWRLGKKTRKDLLDRVLRGSGLESEGEEGEEDRLNWAWFKNERVDNDLDEVRNLLDRFRESSEGILNPGLADVNGREEREGEDVD